MLSNLQIIALFAGGAALASTLATDAGLRTARKAVSKLKPSAKTPLPPVLEPYRRWIEGSAAANGLRPSLLAALLLQESRGDLKATRFEDRATWVKRSTPLLAARKAGWSERELMTAYGLGQVMGATAWLLGYRGKPMGLLEPRTSIEYAARYLGRRLQECKSPELALVAYNGGIGAVRVVRAGGEHPSRRYAQRVLAREAALVAADFSRAIA